MKGNSYLILDLLDQIPPHIPHIPLQHLPLFQFVDIYTAFQLLVHGCATLKVRESDVEWSGWMRGVSMGAILANGRAHNFENSDVSTNVDRNILRAKQADHSAAGMPSKPQNSLSLATGTR
jgi:hypothetical protein